MIRTLHSYPGEVDWSLLVSQLKAVAADLRGCNDVSGQVAVYTDGPQDEMAVATVVAAHVPPLFPPLDETGALATLLVVESVLGLTDAANAIHAVPEHLVHEAESWGVG